MWDNKNKNFMITKQAIAGARGKATSLPFAGSSPASLTNSLNKSESEYPSRGEGLEEHACTKDAWGEVASRMDRVVGDR